MHNDDMYASWTLTFVRGTGPRYRQIADFIETSVAANLFQRGHRIRLDISSSNFPKYDVNPNSGESAADARERRIALNTVHLSAAHPSSVTLCVAAPRDLAPLPAHGAQP